MNFLTIQKYSHPNRIKKYFLIIFLLVVLLSFTAVWFVFDASNTYLLQAAVGSGDSNQYVVFNE